MLFSYNFWAFWQWLYQCLPGSYVTSRSPLHVLEVSAKHCNIFVYHMCSIAPYSFSPVEYIKNKRYYFYFLDVVPKWLTNKLMVGWLNMINFGAPPDLQRQDVLRAQRWGSGGAPEAKQRHPDRKWWFKCWDSTPCSVATDLDVGNYARMIQKILANFNNDLTWGHPKRCFLPKWPASNQVFEFKFNGQLYTQIGYNSYHQPIPLVSSVFFGQLESLERTMESNETFCMIPVGQNRIFSRASQVQPLFSTITWWGIHPKHIVQNHALFFCADIINYTRFDFEKLILQNTRLSFLVGKSDVLA